MVFSVIGYDVTLADMIREIHSISELPNSPAIYAMYGGSGRSKYVAYVGLGSKLKSRIDQHLVRRDSSVTTGVSAVSLNPDLVTEVAWWEHERFEDRVSLEAAELVAFDMLDPALRSRGHTTERARELNADAEFCETMSDLFRGAPSGRLVIRSLEQAWRHIEALTKRLDAVEVDLRKLQG